MSKSLPLLPIDPRKVGPIELVRMKLAGLKAVAKENAPYLIGAGVVLVGIAAHYGIGIPRLPNVVVLMLLALAIAFVPGWLIGGRIARGLDESETVLLSEQNPINGDQTLYRVAPHRFEEMTIENHNGETRSRSFLKEVVINGERAYEVDNYDVEENHALASWQAGASNSAIRADRNRIKRIKTDLEEEADKAIELLTSHPSIIREQAKEVNMEIIRVAEDVEVPGGGQLHEELSRSLEEADPSEELLDSGVKFDGDGSDSDEDGANISLGQESDHESIFERAAAEASRRANGGGSSGGESNE